MQEDLVSWLLAHYGHEVMRPGLSRISQALDNILPHFKQTKIITVAGTNGKGETALRLASLLKEESFVAWTSPHIERLSERFLSEEGEIDPILLSDMIRECHAIVQSHKYELSFYEFLFLVFCTWASKRNPKYLILEVGLGGRLDAVNVFDADLVLLPSISRDHQEILGPRYDKILAEKLGTLRSKTTLVSFLDLKYLRERASKVVRDLGGRHVDLREMNLGTDLHFSQRNQLLASAAYYLLNGLPLNELRLPLGPILLPMRGEIFRSQNNWLFYGSHNVDGMRKLIQFLHSENYTFSKSSFECVIAAFSKRSESDLRVMLKMLKASGFKEVIITTFSHPKAMSADMMKVLTEEEGLNFVEDIKTYVQGWNNRQCLVTGSYYFLGFFKSLIRR